LFDSGLVLLSSVASTVVLIWLKCLTELWLVSLGVVLIVSVIFVGTILIELLGSFWPVVTISFITKTIDSKLILVLGLNNLEVSPLGEDLHCLNVLDSSQLLSVVLVSAERVEVDLLSKTLILTLDELEDVDNLFTVKYLVVVHTSNRVEDCPHNFRVVHSSEMVSDVQAENNLVQFGFFNSNTLIAEWWRKFSQEVWQSNCSHVKLTHWVVFSPCVLEGLNVLLFKSKDIIFILSGLVVIETFTNNSNEDIHEDKESNKLEHHPENE
jgi:hypothetical protein